MNTLSLKRPNLEYKKPKIFNANNSNFVAAMEQAGFFDTPKILHTNDNSPMTSPKVTLTKPKVPKTPTINKPSPSPLRSPSTPKREFRPCASPSLCSPSTIKRHIEPVKSPLFYRKYDNDPWFYNSKDITKNVVINGMLKDGTVAPVPTSSRIPILTNSEESEFSEGEEIDPMLMANIYINSYDNGRTNDQIAQNMKNISTSIKSLRDQYTMKLKTLTNTEGLVKQEDFDKALSIYENNQVYYQECIDRCLLTKKELEEGLSNLEYWFMAIIEPGNIDDVMGWRERELGKLTRGYSGYCDPELYSYIRKIPPNIANVIRLYQAKLGNKTFK